MKLSGSFESFVQSRFWCNAQRKNERINFEVGYFKILIC